MSETKKIAKPKSPAKPKAKVVTKEKAKSVAKPMPKEKPAKAATEALSPKALAPEAAANARKPRAYSRKGKGSFAELLKKQAELEEIKKGAKADLRKQYEDLIKESEKINDQYRELFNEAIGPAPQARTVKIKKTPRKAPAKKIITKQEVEDFIDQKASGITSKNKGRKPKSLARMEVAFKETQDADEMLKILNE
jgi:hypothetical protein